MIDRILGGILYAALIVAVFVHFALNFLGADLSFQEFLLFAIVGVLARIAHDLDKIKKGMRND